MEMGGLVESQIQQAVYALSLFVENVADSVIENEHKVNAM
jgi:phosphate transport system protein